MKNRYNVAITNILTLNMAPRKGQALSLFESLHFLSSPVSGIPTAPSREKFLADRKLIKEKPKLTLPSKHNAQAQKCMIPIQIPAKKTK